MNLRHFILLKSSIFPTRSHFKCNFKTLSQSWSVKESQWRRAFLLRIYWSCYHYPSFHLELHHHFNINEDRRMDILSIFNKLNIQSSLTLSKLIDLVAKLKLFHEFSILEKVSKQSHIHFVGKKVFLKMYSATG